MNNTTSSGIPRRRVLQAAATPLILTAGIDGIAQTAEAPKYGAATMPGGVVDNPLVFVTIGTDGTVTIIAHRAEMGTGVRTSLPMVVADEMEARWDRVNVVQAHADEARFGSQNVDGSRSMRHFLQPMRRVGAAARQMLEAAAAARWSLPIGEVKAVQHEVVHSATGRRFSFGELSSEAAMQRVPTTRELKLKDPAQWRLIGKGRVGGVDMTALARGQATFGMDVRLPGMVYAVVARPPVTGGKLRSANVDAALKVPGVLRVVEIAGFSGAAAFLPLGGMVVVARNTWAATQGRAALNPQWDDGANGGYESGAYRREQERLVKVPGTVYRSSGDVNKAIGEAPAQQLFSAEYFVPHLAHATMEPPVATALVRGDTCEIWTSVQNPQAALEGAAKALGLRPQDTKVNVLLLGGGFGRKSKPDYVTEAALVAKAMPGTPVKLVWTRDDDIQHGFYHAVSLDRLEAVVKDDGLPLAWLHRTAAPTITSLFEASAKAAAPFETGMSATNIPFVIPNVRVERAEIPAHTRIGWFRSVANIPHVFATQCFVDELAHRARIDPLWYAMSLLGPDRKIDPTSLSDTFNYSESPTEYPIDTARMGAVIRAAARGARWGRRLPKGRGLGLAFGYSFLTYAATVVEVEVDDKGLAKVVAVDMALDCGPQVNPERIRAQMEGGCVMGLSLAFTGEITFDAGRVKQSNFHDYEVLRHNQSPRTIRTHLVGGDPSLPPGGVGESPMPPVAPALLNAIFSATGKRIRSLPLRDQLSSA